MQANLRSLLILGTLISQGDATPDNTTVSNWLYANEIDDVALVLLDRPDIEGVQALYDWKSLEPHKNEYNFSLINHDLQLVQAKGKRLWVQLQDRTFTIESNPVPKYLQAPVYNNGSVPQCDGDPDVCYNNWTADGWVTAQWNANVRERFQALLKAMSNNLDGRIYGMNLPETAVIPDPNKINFTCQDYFEGELQNAAYAAGVFHKSYVVQYVNFWLRPCLYANGTYLATSFDFYAKHGIGVGGPDLIPYDKSQENNSYPYLSEYRDKVPISVIAVQEPDLKAINPNTSKPFTKKEFTDFAINRLGSNIIFWATSSPWLWT